MKKWINLEISRNVIDQHDKDLTQDKFSAAKQLLKFLQKLLDTKGEGTFLNEQLKEDFLTKIQTAIQYCDNHDYDRAMESIKNNLVPGIMNDTLDYNKAAFLSIIEQTIFCLTHDGDYLADPLPEEVGKCTTIKIRLHLKVPIPCIHITITAHIESIEIISPN